jgi:hypothetical protein
MTARLATVGRRAVLAAPILLAPAARAAGGDFRTEHDEPLGAFRGPMAVFGHRPAGWRPGGPVVVVMHGVRRDPERYRDEWRELASRGRFLLLVPEFSAEKFPGTRWYNFVGAVDEAGRPAPPQGWTSHAFGRAVAAACAAQDAPAEGYVLYGHSAGAQFVHRHLLLTGAPGARRVIIANAGSYTLPVLDRPFPEGLAGTAADLAGLAAAFRRDAVLQLGEADTDPDHPSLPRQPWAVAQGPHRFARGGNFRRVAEAAAAELGVPLAWRVATVPGVGHSNAGMAEAALALLG